MLRFFKSLSLWLLPLFAAFLLLPFSSVRAQSSLPGDANGDYRVDGLDYVIWLNNYGSTVTQGASRGDFNSDSRVDGIDYVVWLSNYGAVAPTPTVTSVPPTATPTPAVPTPTPGSGSGGDISTTEWIQHGHDAERTGYTSQVVNTPWRWKWSWNGSTSSGGIVGGKIGLPRGTQPVTGGGQVYVAAGSSGVYALNATTGSVAWSANPGGSINSTPAYDPTTQSVFVVSSNGSLYKLNAATGAVSGSFSSGNSSTLPLHPLLLNDRVVFAMGTRVVALNKQNLSQLWSYTSSSAFATPPTYSNTRNRVIVGSQDLNVHAINNVTGTQVWRVKPSPQPASSPYELSYAWPVVSDANGLVLIKMRLDWNTMWTWNPWPTSNSAIRSNLQGNPGQQALYALNLDTGTAPFIVNVGHGGYGDNDFMPMGPSPVVKTFSDGNQVAYTVIRGTNQYDGRWDSNYGEVLLNNSSVSGYSAGEVRWINYISSSQYLLTDEQPFVTMSGDMLFGGHWMAGHALQINDRSASRGTYSNRITSTTLPHIVTSASNCGFSSTHYCSSLTQDGDPRSFPAGFYIYYNQGTVYDRYWGAYSAWVVSSNLVLFRSNDGAIVALEAGSPTSSLDSADRPHVAGIQLSAADSAPTAITPDQAAAYSDRPVTVTETIKYSHENGKQLIISFADHHLGHFKLIIKKDHWPLFGGYPAGEFPVGARITATGTVAWYQGDPAIYVTDPSQLQLVTPVSSPSLVDRLGAFFSGLFH